MTGEESDHLLIGVPAAARLLSVPPSTIYRLVESERVPHHRLGRRILFDPRRLAEWIASTGIEPAGSGEPRRVEAAR